MFLLPRRIFLYHRLDLRPAVSLFFERSGSSLNMDHLKMKMSSLTPFARKHKVTVVGSGNWGSTIAKVVAENTAAHSDLFERDVQMWVYEEEVQLDKKSKHYNESSELSKGPQKLTKLINNLHENVKYLPGIPLPHNVIANPSIQDAVKDSTILIFNLPHQFIVNLCKQLRGHIAPYARGISCIKGVNVDESSVSLFSETIGHELDIYCGALSGANIASEVAQEKFSETTIGYDPPAMDSQNPTPATSTGPSPESSQVDLTQIVHKDVQGKPTKAKLKPLPSEYSAIDHTLLKKLFHRPYFHVRVISDVAGVSLGGALKNIVAISAGWVDGLGWGDNAKAAVMRVGLLEMVEFGKRFFSNSVHTGTFTQESCGVADLITTCAGGRNHRCAKMSIQEGKSIDEIEARELNGQKLQGTLTAIEVNTFLKSQGLEKDFPLFTAVYNILKGNAQAKDLPGLIESHSGSSSQPKTATAPQSAQKSISPPRPSSIFIPAPSLASSRYNRQLLIPQVSLSGQNALSKSKILILGLGGLGSPASLYLAGAGVHTLGLLDDDLVEESNLHRQIVHREDSVKKGLSKVASALLTLRQLNSAVNYVAHDTRLSASNALDIVRQYDLVLDCTDNPATRYLASDACVITGKPLVSGAAQRLEGQMMVLNQPVRGENKGPCYRCVFPRPPMPETVRGCSEIGILGPVVGAIGTMMASEALRVLVQGEQVRKPSMLLYNAWSADPKGMFRTVGLRGRRPDCVACGDDEVLKEKGLERITAESLQDGRMDYIAFCGILEDVKILQEQNRIGASEFMTHAGRSDSLVVDVREENEVELGPKVKNSVNIPLSRILRNGTSVFDGILTESVQSIYFVCQRGNDSQIAAQRLIEKQRENGATLNASKWIGDVKGGFMAMENIQRDLT